MPQHKAQQGFVTLAQNTASVNYLELAYLQALNIKATQTNNLYAVLVDTPTLQLVTEKHRRVFDYVIEIPHDNNTADSKWRLANEWQVFWLTPFKETVKLESDVLFTRSIDHWWTAFRLRDVCLSTGCRNYQQQISHSRKYRQVFDENQLPDVYNGLMYFRYSQTAANFFNTAKQLEQNWSVIRDQLLRRCTEAVPSTDVLYALTAQVIGLEQCAMPSMDFINFVHMKPAHNGYQETQSFQDVFVTEFDQGMIRINNVNQYHPIHYHEKTFATQELIEYYELRRTSQSTSIDR